MVQFYKAPNKANKGKNNKASSKTLISGITIDVLDHHGNGIALSQQPITVVEGALPHETVSAKVISKSKNVCRAKLSKIERASDKRIAAICPVFDECGGCNLQHISAQDGFALKRDALVRYFSSMLKINKDVWRPSIESDIEYSPLKEEAQQNKTQHAKIGYRRKVRFALDARNPDKIKIGYRRAQSNEVVDIQGCPILQSELDAKVRQLLPLLKSLWCIQKIGHFECMQTTDGVLLLINFAKPIKTDNHSAFEHLAAQAQVRVICQFKEQVFADISEHFASLAIEDIPGIKLEMGAQHFIQINAAVNRQMIEQAISWLAPQKDSTVHDFFCGLGNFSVPLAQHCGRAIGYEVVAQMVEQASANARLNGFNLDSTDSADKLTEASSKLNKLAFESVDLSQEKALNKIQIESNDLVLLDPAREGAAALCEFLIKQKPARIVYVSCNPNTLVRDLKTLSACYRIAALSAIDMFPFTQHLETMALLERN
jgi:23S rRNA (uracil1939-C5)-methyltransferase